MPEVSMTDIPESDVGDIVAGLEADECTNIKKEKQPDGKWTVTATCPDEDANGGEPGGGGTEGGTGGAP